MSNIKVFEGRTMSASMYYYGCEMTEWDDLLYPDAIIDRRNRAFELYKELITEKANTKGEMSFEKRKRLWKVEMAYKDNSQLCEERGLII